MSESTLETIALPDRYGYELRARIVTDPDFDAEDSYDAEAFAEHIAAWKRGDWNGVGLVVEALEDGVVVGEAAIFGNEYGVVDGKHWQPVDADGTDHSGHLEDLINEALAAARGA